MFSTKAAPHLIAIWGIVLLFSQSSSALFPKVCMDNATLHDSTCCPIPTGFSSPCGGPGRGSCVKMYPYLEDFTPVVTGHMRDDRFQWPLKFFRYACACERNFQGYQCQECKYGYYGKDCEQKKTVVRKNVMKLSPDEKATFVKGLLLLKEKESEYVALNCSSTDMDPMKTVSYTNVSIIDYFVHLHFYSTRQTAPSSPGEACPTGKHERIDVAHGGAAFGPWHRKFMLAWERELQKVLADESFGLPYWDWSYGGKYCDVCTNDLFGATNYSDPNAYLDKNSVFHDWGTICEIAPGNQSCWTCDPTVKFRLRRTPWGNESFPALPTKDEVDALMNLKHYVATDNDLLGYNVSFQNLLEGYGFADGKPTSTMHNLVHLVMDGSFSHVASAANDPLFIVHHSFVDKLYERWLRKHQPHILELPFSGQPLGHNRQSPLIPFFPPELNYWYFTDSRTLGYTYDEMPAEEGDMTEILPTEEGDITNVLSPLQLLNVAQVPGGATFRAQATGSHTAWIVAGGLGAACLAIVALAVAGVCRRRRKRGQHTSLYTEVPQSHEARETTGLLKDQYLPM